MAFSSAPEDDGNLMSEINMIPLIDVMLVLLIVFMITVPVMTHTVQVQLPQTAARAEPKRPEAIRLTVAADGTIHWNQTPISSLELADRMRQAAQADPQPDVHVAGDRAARYEYVAQVLATAQRSGLRQLAFVTEP
jgi:biopolymer transport protein ExbD